MVTNSRISTETKVGLLVIAALAGLAWLSVRSGSFGFGSFTSHERDFSTIMDNAEGLMEGSLVKVAGVQVGEIKQIKLRSDGMAQVDFSVRDDVPLAASVVAEVNSSGLVGEKFLALVAGPGDSNVPLAEDATVIPAGARVDMQNIGNSFARVGDDLQSVTGNLKDVLGDPENAAKLQMIIDGLATFGSSMQSDGSDIISNLKVASESIKTILGENQGEAGSAIKNINAVAENLAVITERLRNGEGPLGQMLMADGSTSGTNPLGDLQSALSDLRQTMSKINNGEGTIGKLVNDPQTVDKLNDALDSFSDVAGRIEQFRTEVSFEGRSLLSADDSVSKGGFNVLLQPRPTRFYQLGLTSDGYASLAKDDNDPTNPYYGQDFGEELKFTAQFGQIYQRGLFGHDVAVRVGVKDSTGGLGVDTWGQLPYFGNNVKYSADLYDFGGSNLANADNPQFDLHARVDLIGQTVYGLVGYDNVLNSEYGSPVVGIGLRFQDDDLKYLAGQAL